MHKSSRPRASDEPSTPIGDDTSNRKLFAALAALAFAWRLYFVLRFPLYQGDSLGYDELAQNWLVHHVFGLEVGGRLTPLDFRVPGYPALLVLVYAVVGYSRLAVMVVQAALDTVTCLLAGRLAHAASPRGFASQAEVWTVAVAAFCPFLPCYAATLLTEIPVTFFLTAALLAVVSAFRRENWWAWLGAGALTGIATLFRPDSGLLALPVGIALLIRYRARSQWPRLWQAGAMYAAGLGLALTPWVVRNAITLREFQPLARRYAELPGEYVPRGYCRWIRTWLVRYGDIYEAFWKLNEGPIDVARLPDSAFDSPEERARVAALLEQYNATTTMSPAVDRGFADLAAERIARHPWRYYLTMPLQKVLSLWFTPRVETLPYSGGLWPPLQRLREDWQDSLVSLSFAGINLLLIGLAGWGFLVWRRRMAYADLLLAWILLRTAFFAATVETPEPRYVLECYPAVFVLAGLGALAIRRKFRRGSAEEQLVHAAD